MQSTHLMPRKWPQSIFCSGPLRSEYLYHIHAPLKDLFKGYIKLMRFERTNKLACKAVQVQEAQKYGLSFFVAMFY